MTENIKCPTCGSEDIQVRGHYDNDTPCHCFNCPCEWDESKRQPLISDSYNFQGLQLRIKSLKNHNKQLIEENARLKNSQLPNAWIACSERPPENQQEVIFYVAGKRYPFVTCGKYQHDRWIDLDGAYLDETQARTCNIPIHDRVTLWQPLPQPPKTESEA